VLIGTNLNACMFINKYKKHCKPAQVESVKEVNLNKMTLNTTVGGKGGKKAPKMLMLTNEQDLDYLFGWGIF